MWAARRGHAAGAVREEARAQVEAQSAARLRAKNARLLRRIEQAETIIEVQKEVSTLLGNSIPEANGENS